MKHFLLCLGMLLAPFFISAQTFSSNSSIYCLPGDTLTISGSGFNSIDSQVSLSLGHVKVQLIQAETNQLKFVAPNGTFSGKLIYTDKLNKKSVSSRFNVFIRNRAKASFDFNYIYANSEQLEIENTYYGLEHSWFYDLDGDGKVEILSVTDGSVGIYAYETIIFAEKLKFGSNTRIAEVLDLNMDGKPDLLLDSLHQKRAYLNRSAIGDIRFEFADTFNYDFNLSPSSRSNIGLLDFNGDGRADLLNTKFVSNNDSNIVLNLADSGIGFKLRKSTAIALVRELNSSEGVLAVADLNDDNLSDLIHNYRDTVLNKDIIRFLINTSVVDTIRFLAVDTLHNVKIDTFRNANYNDRVDINGDGTKEWVFTNMKLSASGENAYFLVLSKDNNSKFSIYSKTGQAKSSKVNFLIDYNFDSIPEYFTVNNDTVYHVKLSMLNDTVSINQTMLMSNVSDVIDLNHDNILDLVNFRSSMPVVCLGRTHSYQVYNQNVEHNVFDSLETIKDSIIINIKTVESLVIDSIKSRDSIVFYSNNLYTSKINGPIVINNSTKLVLYYSYKFTNEKRDTLSMVFAGKKTDFAYLYAKKREKFAIVNSISSRFAEPGDTITIKGKYLFEDRSNITVRLNNRRCVVLNSSSDSSIQFEYPSMTGTAQLVLIDTFRKKQYTTPYFIDPKYKSYGLSNVDSRFYDKNMPGFFNTVNEYYLKSSYTEFELPLNTRTGHFLQPSNCAVSQVLENNVVPFGTFRFNTVNKSSYRPLRINANVELSDKIYSMDNYGYMKDLDGNGLFDNLFLSDSLKAYFCTSVSDTQLNYELRFLSPPQVWAHEFSLDYDLFADMQDINKDGKLDFLINSDFDLNTFYVFNLNQDATGFELVDSGRYINRDKGGFYEFRDVDDDGYLDQVYYEADPYYRYWYFNRNLSQRGGYQFSEESTYILEEDANSPIFGIRIQDINNDGNAEAFVNGRMVSGNSSMYVFTKKAKGSSEYSLLDTFHYDGLNYSLKDIDNDGKYEVLANKIYKVDLAQDSISSREINIGDVYNGNYQDILMLDFNDDQLVDFFDGQEVHYNRGLILKAGKINQLEFTLDSFGHSTTKTIWLTNVGNGDLQIDTVLFFDSSYSCSLNDSLSFVSKSKVNMGDSVILTIEFKPTGNSKKSFKTDALIKFKNSELYSKIELKGTVRQPAIIESIVPNVYFAGDTLLLKGRYLNCFKKPIIYFDETIAEVLSFNDSMMLLIAPPGNNWGKITLWDTFANLYSVSPFPTNYAFVGSKNPLTNTSFDVVKLSSTKYSANFLDVDRDGLTDWAYLNGGTTGYTKNNSNSDSILLDDKPVANLGTLPYNNGVLELVPGFSTNNLHSTSYVVSQMGSGTIIGFNYQYTTSQEAITTNLLPLGRKYLNDIDGNGKPELNVKIFGNSSLFIELERYYEDQGCDHLYEKLKTRTMSTSQFGGGGIHTYDFDGDGKAELFYQDTVFKIAFNSSTKDSIMKSNTYRFNESVDGNYKVRDFNLDGKLDLIANRRLNGNVNELVIFRNTSTKGNLSFVTSLDTLPVELSYANFEVSDFNGDLLPDLALIGGYFVNDTIDFYTNLSDANNIRFGANARFRVPGEELLSKHTDFNGDGKTDLLISTDSGIYVMINKCISGFLSRTKYNGTSLYGTPLSLDLVIYSDGGDTLKIDRINLPPGFSLSNSSGLLRFALGTGISFPILIAPGDSFVLQLENDSLLAPGEYSDNVEFFNNAKNKPFILNIKRSILSNPLAEVNATKIDFGDREYQSAVIDSVILRSTGTDTLKINSIQLSDTSNFQLVSVVPSQLAPKDSVWIKVMFLSKKVGYQTEYLYIKHNAFDSIAGVVLEAQTVRPILPDSVVIDMGTVKKGTKKTVFYELVNTGKDSLEMNSPISYNGSMFKMSQVDLSRTLVKAGDSVRLKIDFDATVFGLQNEDYQYNYVSGNFKTKFVFKGSSIGSNLQLNSKQIELGNIRKGKKRNYRIQFSNTGNQTLVIRSLDASNSNWKVGICDTKDSIQSNGNSEVCLEIDPVVNGVLMDSIKIISNDLDSIHFIKVKAEVISAEPILVQQADTIKEFVGQYDKSVISIRNIGNDTMFNVLGSFANVSNVKVIIRNNLSNNILPGAQQDFDLYFHPLSMISIKDNFKLESMYDTTLFSSGIQFVSYNGAFGDLDRNSIYAKVNKTKDTVLKIKNIGNYKFKLNGFANVSSQVNYLPIVNEVLPDDELAFNVKISPNVYSASIVDTLKLIAIVDSLPIQKNYPIHYYLLYPKIELSAIGFDYGLVDKGSEALRNLAIKNTGNDTLFYNLKMPVGFESNQGNDTVLMAGQTKNLQIKFKPDQLKVYSDSIDVIANSQIRHSFVRLTGICKLHKDSFNLYSSTGDIDFGKVRINDSLLKTVEIRNDGSDSITLKALINHSAFKLKTSSTLTLLKGESKFVNIEFHPSLDINYNGKLIFTNLYGDSIKSIEVRGKGHTTSVLNSSIQDIMVYPNPANDVVILTSIKLINSIYAYDQNGKKFDVQFNIENDFVEIDTKEWTNGVYILTVTSGSDQYLVKLVVMHD